jgi:hypothetical protein
MPGRTTSEAPPLCPGDDPHGVALALDERVDRRVGADVRGVERAGETGLDGGRAGVELLGRQLRVTEGLGERPRASP